MEEHEEINILLTRGINQGVNYLYEHQLPNGEFCCYYAPDTKMQEWCVPDSVVFPAALIAACLLPMRGDDPKVDQILAGAARFLNYQMMSGGVWNYFTKWNPLFKISPADADDTVFASYVLKSLGYSFPDNERILLGNRNSKGIFFTWFVLRPKLNSDLRYWKVMSRELKRPLHSLLFWFKHECGRNDIDAVVNANVLFYLGLNEETKPVVNYLLDIIKNDSIGSNDHWYKDPFVFYYFVSRNYPVVKELETVREIIIERIYSRVNDNGSLGDSIMGTALAITTLINFNVNGKVLDNAIKYILQTQSESGFWARNIFFFAGPSQIVGWGSEEMITGYCLEALFRYKKLINTD